MGDYERAMLPINYPSLFQQVIDEIPKEQQRIIEEQYQQLCRLKAEARKLVERAEGHAHYRGYISEPRMNGNFISEAYWFLRDLVDESGAS